MRRCSYFLCLGFFMAIFITRGNTYAVTVPYYSHVDIYASGGTPPGTSVSKTVEGPKTSSLDDGFWPACHVSDPGCAIVVPPPHAGGWAKITADPESGTIGARVGAIHFGPKAGWWVDLPGTSFYYEPWGWGYCNSFGYIRSVWEVVSPDGTLQPRDLVDIEANISIGGNFYGGPKSLVEAMLFLNKIEDVHWLVAGIEYLSWGSAEDILGTPELSANILGYMHYGANSDGITDINYTDSITRQVRVGDFIVVETLVVIDASLENDGETREVWAEFDDTIQSSLRTTTPGAALIPYTGPVGDLDRDADVDLADVILALQVCAAISPTPKVYKEADVNGDGKIGLEEVIYILQEVSGLR